MSLLTKAQSTLSGDSPLIGPDDQRLFAIVDTRERADLLRKILVPKLKSLLDKTCDLLRDIYGSDALSPYRTPTTPAHRPEAKKTQPFDMATAGLAVEGQAWYFQQRFECTLDRLYVTFFGLRGLEGNPIVQVMKKYPEDVIRLLNLDQYEIRSSSIEPSIEVDDLDFAEIISRLHLVPEREWNGTSIIGPSTALPIEDLDAAWPVLYDFVSLFPIFRAATDILRREDDRFEYYMSRFWDWQARFHEQRDGEEPRDIGNIASHGPVPQTLNETSTEDFDSAWEGGFKVAIRRHRLREKRLRKQKTRDALGAGNGQLHCEVPGCGFNFFEVYGELGRDFAHVHHKNPLSDRTGPEKTKLSDLAIVCANCHAMIHRGGCCRVLEELIPGRE